MLTTNPTMTSREIADPFEKRHDNVVRTINTLVSGSVIALPQFEEVPNDGPGPATVRQYRLGKRDSIIVVAQLCPEFTARLVDRWQELEARAPAPAELSRMDLLTIAMDSERERLALADRLAAAAPAIEFVDRYADSTGLKGFRQVCKLLGAKEPALRQFLKDEKIMYPLGGEWVPFAQHLDAGRFAVKAGTSERTGHAYNSGLFTAKGVAWVAGEFAKWQLRQKEGQHA